MRPSLVFLVALSVSGAQASWFGPDGTPEYNNWSSNELEAWLNLHNIPIPAHSTLHPSKAELRALVKTNWDTTSTWTQDQYYATQKSFADVKDGIFTSWSNARLREFLMSQGVVQPSGPREYLELMAKQKYNAYMAAASSFTAAASSTVSSVASGASSSVSSVASQASASASSAYYGDTSYQMSSSLSSIAAQATREVGRTIDDSKDYIYSTWDDNRLRSYLEQKGVIKTKTEMRRDEMLKAMKNAYGKGPTAAAWDSWNDSYIRGWLVSHNILKDNSPPTTREQLTAQMQKYYYDANDKVYSTWNDVDLKKWLVQNHIVKSEAQIEREKLLKLMEVNYANAQDTIWGGWSDSSMREWLVDNGYLKSNAQVKRDELINLMKAKYTEAGARTSPYLVWPDARLRAYLRERGIPEDALPTSRPGLLQEVRIRWIQTTRSAESVFARVRDVVNGGVQGAEDKLKYLMEILSGSADYAAQKTNKAADEAGEKAREGYDYAGQKYEEGKDAAYEKYEEGKAQANYATKEAGKAAKDARVKAGQKVQKAGEKVEHGEL